MSFLTFYFLAMTLAIGTLAMINTNAYAQVPPPAVTAPLPPTIPPVQNLTIEQFMEIAVQCTNAAMLGSVGAPMTQEQCTVFLQQGQEKWCGLTAYDAFKCEQLTKITDAWNKLLVLSKRFGSTDIPSLGELGIDPRTIVPPGVTP